MKLTATVIFVITYALALLVTVPAYLLPALLTVAFAIYGISKSISSKLDPLNDVPNAFRVFLASSGGSLLAMSQNFLIPSIGILLFLAGLFLNDEYQRRAIDSIRRGRRGGSVALLGIDGSGKSSHASTTEIWLSKRGYTSLLMPFHRYLFVERLSGIGSSVAGRTGGRRGRKNPLRPVLSLFDNLILQLSSSFGCRLEGRVVLYDRFIWSTYIKYYALRYPVRPLSALYLLPRPRVAIVLDVPVEKSLGVIQSRESHIRYPRSVLETERRLYLKIAKERGYPIIDSTRDAVAVQEQIERHLSRYFPVVGGTTK